MFVQVMQGKVEDARTLRAQWDTWKRDVKPGAIGYLGSTGGIAEDGTFVTVTRFESQERAMENSHRPEQDAWWSRTEPCFEGPVTFHDCTEVHVALGGGSDDAGFVQVIQGHPTDRERDRQIGRELEEKLSPLRPDYIGGLVAVHPDGGYTSVNYFTSEAEARKGESQDYPEDVAALFAEMTSLVPDMRYIDLKEPWLDSA
jgi:hypothetical protein